MLLAGLVCRFRAFAIVLWALYVCLTHCSALLCTVFVLLVALPSSRHLCRLSANETEVVCDSASMRLQLLDCIMKQLHRVK